MAMMKLTALHVIYLPW